MAQTIPTGWEEKTLGEICVIIAGQSPNSQFYNTEANGLPFYQGKKEFTNKYIGTPSVWTTETTKEALPGDILMSVRAPVGPINYATERCCIGRGLASIRNGELISKDFLFYYLLSIQQKIGGHDGAVFNSISRNEISALKILLPSLSEQERIVAKLDKSFEAIDKVKANAEKNLNNAKELFETALNNAFKKTDNIEQLKLDDIAEITSSKRIYKNEYTPLGIPFYRTKEIKELAHNLPISLELYISADKYMEIKNKFGVPSQNDLLISAVGTIGEIYIVQANDKFYFKDGNIIWFKKYKKEINVEYLKYCLTAFVKEIQNMTQGAAYNALTIEKLKEYKINIVNLTEQNEIVRKIKSIRDNIAKLEAIYTKKIKDLDELKQSILQKAFRGEL